MSYVNVDGMIWEIDGRRNQPLHKGECTPEEFGVRIASLLKGYAQMDDTPKFSLMALSPDQ